MSRFVYKRYSEANQVSQSSTIAGFLLVGFLVFITARGELPKYLQVVGL